MARTRDAPSDNRFSHFRVEEAEVTDVNRKTWTCRVESRHRAKTVFDIQVLSPYTHYQGGEGIHHLPEVGAICYLAFPSDNTPPFIMGYKGAASVRRSEDEGPERSADSEGSSDTDVSFQARRPNLNPGDIALTTRDQNFLFLRRGGVLQIGATPISQRVYIPVLNYIKDFCENYELANFAGEVSWQVLRQEDDPSGNAPATYVLRVNTSAQDENATVRVRYMALAEPGESRRRAWEVKIAPNGINREDGSITEEVYSLIVEDDGAYAEIVGAARDVRIKGDDTLNVEGTRTVNTTSDFVVNADGSGKILASQTGVLGGSRVKLGSEAAASPIPLGDVLVQLLASSVYIVSGPTAVMSPGSAVALQQALSRKAFTE
jgi:hypothetical protein